MTPDTYIADPARWTNNPNDVIALLSIAVVFLIFFVIWLIREGKENRKSLSDNTEVLNRIYGAINRGSKND